MDPTQRRGSWARAFDKVRATIKRRASSPMSLPQTQTPTPGQEATSANQPALTVSEPANALPAAQPSALQDEPATQPSLAPEPLAATVDTIPADTEDQANLEALDEPQLPMLSSRTRITDSRARQLFAQYGLQYEPRSSRRSQHEPPSKIRRVEKPVRLRVHWTCHECQLQFGVERICVRCGHRRCTDCTRHPPKRVMELLDTTRQEMEQEMRQDAVATSSSTVLNMDVPAELDPDLLQYRQEPAAPPPDSSPNGFPRTQIATGELIPQQFDVDETSTSLDSPSAPLMTYARPRAAVVLKPKAQIVRRTCHKCEFHIVPAGRRDCANCGHERCDLCPRYPPKKEFWSESAMKTAHQQAPMVKAVQRVYRKPRQRIRYTCEHCSTVFVDSDRCIECGHERCEGCHREPPRRLTREFDPAVVESVASRLNQYAGDAGQPPRTEASVD